MIISLEITITKADRTLILTQVSEEQQTNLMVADIVSGCEDTGTPTGNYTVGKWIKNKTNPTHGPTPWSKDPWKNPYGPYFLPLHNAKTGTYTTYGIHGTRGPLIGGFEKPPVPEGLLSWFIGDDNAKYLYCSHGCIRTSNQNIVKLFEQTSKTAFIGSKITVTIK